MVEFQSILEQADLRQLIGHRESVRATDTLEEVHKRFTSHDYEFMLVMDGNHLAGLCERRKIGMLLGARYGFAIHSRQPIREALLPETTIIRLNQPLPEVLAAACSRPDSRLYDDVVLVDEAETVLGVIFSRTLVRLQNGLLQEKIQQLEIKQRELNKKNEEMEGDLHLAREIQLAMLPSQVPQVASNGEGREMTLRLGYRYESAGVVSGDFFHVLKISEYAVGVFICDVMGHGVRSAFVTAMLRAMVEEMRASGGNPGELLTRINAELRGILKPLDGVLYATAFYLVADLERRQIRFAKAGHPSPLIMQRRSGEVRTLKCAPGTQGPALGILAGAKYGSNEDALEPGELILLYTDGLCEVFDAAKNEFGLEGLVSLMKSIRDLPLDAWVDGLLAEVRNHSATRLFDDDVCLVALEAVDGGQHTDI